MFNYMQWNPLKVPGTPEAKKAPTKSDDKTKKKDIQNPLPPVQIGAMSSSFQLQDIQKQTDTGQDIASRLIPKFSYEGVLRPVNKSEAGASGGVYFMREHNGTLVVKSDFDKVKTLTSHFLLGKLDVSTCKFSLIDTNSPKEHEKISALLPPKAKKSNYMLMTEVSGRTLSGLEPTEAKSFSSEKSLNQLGEIALFDSFMAKEADRFSYVEGSPRTNVDNIFFDIEGGFTVIDNEAHLHEEGDMTAYLKPLFNRRDGINLLHGICLPMPVAQAEVKNTALEGYFLNGINKGRDKLLSMFATEPQRSFFSRAQRPKPSDIKINNFLDEYNEAHGLSKEHRDKMFNSIQKNIKYLLTTK
ncbi:hypothetical protein HOH45_05500 [bacterium]|jgi:hypothetical protein|nr:hypothetical protein [bacterium]